MIHVSCGATFEWNIFGGTFTWHYLFFTTKFGNVVDKFFFDFGHYWNEPSNKFKYFKTGNSGPWKHFQLFDFKRNYIICMLWFNFIVDLYIYIYKIVSNSWPCHYHSLPYHPKKQKKNNRFSHGPQHLHFLQLGCLILLCLCSRILQ